MSKIANAELFMEQRKKRGRREWLEIVNQQQGSGLSARAFCRAEDIGLVSFYQWRRRLRGQIAAAGNGTGEIETAGKIGSCGKTESRGVFLDLGQVASSGLGSAGGGGRWTVTLDLGEGLKLTLTRN